MPVDLDVVIRYPIAYIKVVMVKKLKAGLISRQMILCLASTVSFPKLEPIGLVVVLLIVAQMPVMFTLLKKLYQSRLRCMHKYAPSCLTVILSLILQF